VKLTDNLCSMLVSGSKHFDRKLRHFEFVNDKLFDLESINFLIRRTVDLYEEFLDVNRDVE